jgi:NitT/TauT family transport system substrate-binding protein
MARRLKPFAKILIVAVVLLGIVGIYKLAGKMGFIPSKKGNQEITSDDFDGLTGEPKKLERPIRVCVVTWGGYAGGQYFNGGFEASKESRFYKDYGILVEFKVIDDFVNSREAWKAGEVDLLWMTVGAFSTEVKSMEDYEPKIIFQADWSRGGDAIVSRRGIESVADLKGKSVAVAFGTPSHTFLLWVLQAGDLKYSDVKIVEAPSAIDAAAYFKAGKVDAAVVWSPDDEDCVKNVSGAKVLKSTKEASFIIADVFYVKNNFLKAHKKELKGLVEGWLKGASELNQSDAAKRQAAKILAKGLRQPEDFCYNAINNVRLCTYGDNANFFNLSGDYKGVKGENIYNTMGKIYNKINLAPSDIPAWRSVIDTSLLMSLNLDGAKYSAEKGIKFTRPTVAATKKKAFSTKRVRISFGTGSYTLDENAKYIIDKEFADIAKSFGHSRIRIEGNTDNTGSRERNMSLSRQRAQSVANFLAKEYQFDPNRFIIIGNGPDKPVASNDTDDGRAKNRRTDFELLSR